MQVLENQRCLPALEDIGDVRSGPLVDRNGGRP
jgi:hypothetical protein